MIDSVKTSGHVFATVDRQRGACDEPGMVLDQEQHSAGDFLRRRQSADGDRRDNAFQDLGRNGVYHARIGITGAIALTVMPRAALSSASALVNPITPAFAAA